MCFFGVIRCKVLGLVFTETDQIPGVTVTDFRSCMQQFFRFGYLGRELGSQGGRIIPERVSAVGLEFLRRGNVC